MEKWKLKALARAARRTAKSLLAEGDLRGHQEKMAEARRYYRRAKKEED